MYLYISLPCHAHHHSRGGDVKSTLHVQPVPSLRLPLKVLIFRHHPFSCCPQQRHPAVSFPCILDSLQDTVCRVLGDLNSVNPIMPLSVLMAFLLFCSQIPPQGPYLAGLRTSRGKGLELRSHLTWTKPGRCLLYTSLYLCAGVCIR